VEALPGPFAREAALALAGESTYWSFTSSDHEARLTWHLSGTLPDWSGTPLALVILLEVENETSAKTIGQDLLLTALQPK
jgi:hypothetical protein